MLWAVAMWNTIKGRWLAEMGTKQWGLGFTLEDRSSGLLWCFPRPLLPWCNHRFLALFVLETLYIVCYRLSLFPSDRQTCVEGRWYRTLRESSVTWGWRQRLEFPSHKLQTIWGHRKLGKAWEDSLLQLLEAASLNYTLINLLIDILNLFFQTCSTWLWQS